MLLHGAWRMSANSIHPTPPAVQQQHEEPPASVQGSALVKSAERGPVLAAPRIDRESVISRMPVEVEVGVPVRDFRVRNLLALNSGAIVRSQWNHGEDLPISAGHVQLAWVQFEVLDSLLAARVTRPA